jgi:hypothetical protein
VTTVLDAWLAAVVPPFAAMVVFMVLRRDRPAWFLGAWVLTGTFTAAALGAAGHPVPAVAAAVSAGAAVLLGARMRLRDGEGDG